MIDKYCTREQVKRLLTLGVERKYSHSTFLAESRAFYFFELMDYLPDTVLIGRRDAPDFVPKYSWFFKIERQDGLWTIGYDDIGSGGDVNDTVECISENPAIAAADLLIYLKENNYV